MLARQKRTPIAALACFALGALVAGCRSESKPPEKPLTPVTVVPVEQYSGNEGVTYSASIVPYVQVSLAFKSGGYVTEILQRKGVDGRTRNIQQGDFVKKDTVLATVRQDDYRHTVEQYSGSVQQAQAAAQKTKQDFDRSSVLYAANALTQPDYDAAKAQNDAAQGSLQAAQAVLDQAKQSLADCELRVPMDATVLSRNVELGSLVGAGTTGFVVGDIHLVKAVFGIPDTVLANVTLGKKQAVVTETYTQEFVGQVTAISPQADQKSRTFQIEVTIPNERALLKAGMVATLDLGQSKLQHAAMVVPLSAIVSLNDGSKNFSIFVVTQEGGRDVARRRSIAPGEAYGNRVAITGNVALGDRVIANGATLVVDGQPIRVTP